jgi:hypothetical protein
MDRAVQGGIVNPQTHHVEMSSITEKIAPLHFNGMGRRTSYQLSVCRSRFIIALTPGEDILCGDRLVIHIDANPWRILLLASQRALMSATTEIKKAGADTILAISRMTSSISSTS